VGSNPTLSANKNGRVFQALFLGVNGGRHFVFGQALNRIDGAPAPVAEGLVCHLAPSLGEWRKPTLIDICSGGLERKQAQLHCSAATNIG
jgi:hypothetical protein